MSLVIRTVGETQEKAIEELYEKFKVLEEGMKDLFPYGTTSFDGKNLGLLDILLCSTFGPYKVQEEVLGVKVIDPEKTPLIFSWVTALIELPVMKDLMPPHEKLVEVFQTFRNFALKISCCLTLWLACGVYFFFMFFHLCFTFSCVSVCVK